MESKSLSWTELLLQVTSKRGPSTALRARKERGKNKDARNSAQDDRPGRVAH